VELEQRSLVSAARGRLPLFKGSPQYVTLDNLKEGVLNPDIHEPELNPLYAATLNHYDVVADPARVNDPDRKATVGNAIKYTQDAHIAASAIRNIRISSILISSEWQSAGQKKLFLRMVHRLILIFQVPFMQMIH
jgi:hypothetical protein